MILGEIKKLEDHIGPVLYNLIISFIGKVKKNETEIGQWIFLNDEIKALVLVKSGYSEGVFEAHTIFKDIHIVVDGFDTIFLGDTSHATIKAEYDEKGDYTLYNSTIISSVKMNTNTFALIDQGEMHSNRIEEEVSKKIVVKVKGK